MNTGKIRSQLEHSEVGRKWGGALRRCGAVHLLHTLQYAKRRRRGEYKHFVEFYEQHKKDFQEAYKILEDDLSRRTYKNVVRFRKTYKMKYINAVNIKPQYFLKDIVPPCENEVFIDGGAYIGDTASEFLRLYQEGGNYKIYLWEPDEINISEIDNMLGVDAKYEVKPYAMWSRRDVLKFSGDGTSVSSVSDDGIEVQADSIDNQHSADNVTFIKMDIEGAEIEALKGAEKTIKRCKPKLAICIYHEPDHLYRIPLMIKEMVPEYRIYIRHHSDTASETVCYAVV